MRHTLKFADKHIRPILDGEKTLTARLGVTDVQPDDPLVFTTEISLAFARATVSRVDERRAGDFAMMAGLEPFEGHREYPTSRAFLDEMREYYPDEDLTRDTLVTIIHWRDLSPDTYYQDAFGDWHDGREGNMG